MADAAASQPAIYLDHAATTPVRTEVADAMTRAQVDAWANPSSPHAAGRRAKRLLEDCREAILALLGGRTTGVARDRLVFTSGATEANRLAILGLAGGEPGTFASSARDHGSVRELRGGLAGRGWRVVEMPLSSAGCIDPAWTMPAGGRGLLACTLVCGQSGAVDEPRRIATACPGLAMHVDATQAVVAQRVSFRDLGAATLAVAPHKFEGPRGIGAVVIRGDVAVEAVTPGPQEAGLRGGTEPVILAVGFARALELAVAEREATVRRLAAMRERFAASCIAAAAGHGLTVRRIVTEEGSPHLLALAVPGIDRQAFVMAADLAGVCCATGTACASGSSQPAPALEAMGLPADIVASTVRFSFGRTTGADEVDDAVARLETVFARFA